MSRMLPVYPKPRPSTRQDSASPAGDAGDRRRRHQARAIGREMRCTIETLSTSGLSGIIAYNPAEMVMTANAGTPLAEIEAALASHRQMLAFEPMDYRGCLAATGEPTIGGIFACNLSGPRRFEAGAARDICSACASSMAGEVVNGRRHG